MKIKEKTVFNTHTNEIIDFYKGAFNTDILKTELVNSINNGS